MNSMRILLEAISDNPWAAMGFGTWALSVLAMLTSTAQECLALVVTRSRFAQPTSPAEEQATEGFGADASQQ